MPLTKERFEQLSRKGINELTPEEFVELNSCGGNFNKAGFVQIGIALEAIKLTRLEQLNPEERLLKLKYD